MRASAGRRILMLLENSTYPADARVRMEARTLSAAGFEVSIIAPRGPGQPWAEELESVQVYRFPRGDGVSGVPGILLEYALAMVGALVLTLRISLGRGFDVLHAHNPPDAFALIAALFKPLGKKFVFDHHDLSPEMYCARFGKEPGGPVYRALLYLEKLSFRLADHVISTNDSYRVVARLRGGVPDSRITVVRNGPELDRVAPVPADQFLRGRAPNIFGYVGVLGYQDGVDYLLRALARLVHDLDRHDFYCVIVGKGDALEELRALARRLDIADRVEFPGFVPDAELMRILSTVDICVDPDPYNPFNDSSSMIKLTEYMALGKPIVAFDLTEHRVTAGEAASYARPNDELDFARVLAKLMDDPSRREVMGRLGLQRVRERLAWVHQAPDLIAAYEAMIGDPARAVAADYRA